MGFASYNEDIIERYQRSPTRGGRSASKPPKGKSKGFKARAFDALKMAHCPVCRTPLRIDNADGHMQRVHSYRWGISQALDPASAGGTA